MSLIAVLNNLGFSWAKDATEMNYRWDNKDDADLHRPVENLNLVLFCRELGLRVYEYKTSVPGYSIRSLHGNNYKPLHEKPFTRIKQLKNLIEQTIVSMLNHVYEDNEFEICMDCQETIHEDQKHDCDPIVHSTTCGAGICQSEIDDELEGMMMEGDWS